MSKTLRNQNHLIKFIEEFYGYGSWEAIDWFLGIEEGGGACKSHVEQKLSQFYYWGNIQDGLVDNFEFQSLLDEARLGGFLDVSNSGGPKAQSTWIYPMKALLMHRNGVWPTPAQAKWSQVLNLGRQNHSVNTLNSCWIELFPLPNPGTAPAKYSLRWPEWTREFDDPWKLPYDREDYEHLTLPNGNSLIQNRIQYITQKMIKHKPRNVIMYIGTNAIYRAHIQALIATVTSNSWVKTIVTTNNGKYIEHLDINWGGSQVTRCMMTYHPARTNDTLYWQSVSAHMV